LNGTLNSAPNDAVGLSLRNHRVTRWAKVRLACGFVSAWADPADWKLLRTEGGVSIITLTTVR